METERLLARVIASRNEIMAQAIHNVLLKTRDNPHPEKYAVALIDSKTVYTLADLRKELCTALLADGTSDPRRRSPKRP